MLPPFLALPPGAMPPRLSSWPPPSAFPKVSEEPSGHRPARPRSTVNLDKNLPPLMQSNSSSGSLPGYDLTENTHRPTNVAIDQTEGETDYHLPPITVSSPITLAPLVVVEPLPPPPPPKSRPKCVGPGYEYLRKSSPHMQRYVESLADRIWGDVDGNV
jgi:hypothetical protein